MATTTTYKTGVTDTASGAGVHEYLGLQEDFGTAMSQAVTHLPFGDALHLKGSLSMTPTLITDTLPPSPLLAWRVPVGKALLFTGGQYHSLSAATDYVRVCRRAFLFGYQATAAPVAPAAPTVALTALTDGIGTSLAYTYKIAAIDTFRKESPASVASSSVTLTATNRGVTVTPPALSTGAIGFNIYRTLGGGATWYYVATTLGATAYIDAQPDASIDTSLTPLNNWATGAIVGETTDGPCEVIIEVGAVALTGAPTTLVYTGPYNTAKQAIAVTFPSTVGQRIRAKLFGETSNFIPVGTAANNTWRGLYTSDIRGRHEEDYGATAVSGINAAPSAGSFIVWGQQVIGISERIEATAAIKANRILPNIPAGFLLGPLTEIVVEIGALALGVAGVRDVAIDGLLIPTVAT